MTMKSPFNILATLTFWKKSPSTKWLEGLVNPVLIWTWRRKKNFYHANNYLLLDNGLKPFPGTLGISTTSTGPCCAYLVLEIDEKTSSTICLNNYNCVIQTTNPIQSQWNMVAEEGCLNETYIALDTFMSLKAFCLLQWTLFYSQLIKLLLKYP